MVWPVASPTTVLVPEQTDAQWSEPDSQFVKLQDSRLGVDDDQRSDDAASRAYGEERGHDLRKRSGPALLYP